MLDATTELGDLHIHVGGAVAPHVLWSIAHEQGFKLPVQTYWEFCDLVSATPNKVASQEDYLAILHQWTEKIQSSPAAIERSVHEIIGKEFRSSRVSLLELRFNPMKRNLGGERDLDHIIHAALRGMDRGALEYGTRVGLIFCLAREFPVELNEILVKKAIRYRSRGVVGVDLAGPERFALELGSEVEAYAELFDRARSGGLGVTIHTGETPLTGVDGMLVVMDKWRPSRIGHGIAAAQSEEAMRKLVEQDIVLELCPSSNLRTRVVATLPDIGHLMRRFNERNVRFTINTDGPYLLDTHLRQEFELLIDGGVLTDQEALRCIETAKQATFLHER
jgi:adenosine deaminase